MCGRQGQRPGLLAVAPSLIQVSPSPSAAGRGYSEVSPADRRGHSKSGGAEKSLASRSVFLMALLQQSAY